MSKTVLEIVKEWLVANKYDGLVNTNGCDGCGCTINDLAPCCVEPLTHCKAAKQFKVHAKDDKRVYLAPEQLDECDECGGTGQVSSEEVKGELESCSECDGSGTEGYRED